MGRTWAANEFDLEEAMKKAAQLKNVRLNRWNWAVLIASITLGVGMTDRVMAGTIEPIVECMIRPAGGTTWYTLWGYRNNGSERDVPIGQGADDNFFAPGPDDQGQPAHFLVGRQEGVFWTDQPSATALTWSIDPPGGALQTATANASTTLCTDEFPPDVVSSSTKGSLLIFSKVEIRWNDVGDDQFDLVQDTFLDFANDYPENVNIQAYFINGDISLEECCECNAAGGPQDNCCECIGDEEPLQDFEPGWNTADCSFTLTAGQPHYWSAALGSNKCQPFSVLDSGRDGPGRPDETTPSNSDRVLRGYVIMWAVDFNEAANIWHEIRWNHLKGDGAIVNYENGTAWEYNAWSFQSGNVNHGEFTGTPGALLLNGVEYSRGFSELILDFYEPGTNLGSVDGKGLDDVVVHVNTDLTVHPLPVDLRQDDFGPILTKVDAFLWNEFEHDSSTRRCICCWDQTMLDVWSHNIPGAESAFNSINTSKGKARLIALNRDHSECDFDDICGDFDHRNGGGRGAIYDEMARLGIRGPFDRIPILGLATKFLAFTGNNNAEATAGMNLPGAGARPAVVLYDILEGSEELRDSIRRPDSGKSAESRADAGTRESSLRVVPEGKPTE